MYKKQTNQEGYGKLSLDKVEKVIGGKGPLRAVPHGCGGEFGYREYKGSLSGCLTARTCRVRFYLFRPTQNRMSTR